jgi:hypothetical protein
LTTSIASLLTPRAYGLCQLAVDGVGDEGLDLPVHLDARKTPERPPTAAHTIGLAELPAQRNPRSYAGFRRSSSSLVFTRSLALAAFGAKAPRRFPTWLARLIAGEAAVVMGTTAPRRLQRERQARTRLDVALPELAARLRRGLRQTRILDIRASIARAHERRPPAFGFSMTQSDAIASLLSNPECGPPTVSGRTTFRLAQLATTRVSWGAGCHSSRACTCNTTSVTPPPPRARASVSGAGRWVQTSLRLRSKIMREGIAAIERELRDAPGSLVSEP